MVCPHRVLAKLLGLQGAIIKQEPAQCLWHWNYQVPFYYQEQPKICRLLNGREEKQHLMAVVVNTQPSTTCDPTKSSSTGQLSVIMVRVYRVGGRREGKTEWFVG